MPGLDPNVCHERTDTAQRECSMLQLQEGSMQQRLSIVATSLVLGGLALERNILIWLSAMLICNAA